MGWEWHNRERKQGRFSCTNKTARLMVRCNDLLYEKIRGRAYARGLSISGYILDLVRRDLKDPALQEGN